MSHIISIEANSIMTTPCTSNGPAAKSNMPRNALLLTIYFLLSASSTPADAFAFSPPRSLFRPMALSNDNADRPRSHSRTSTQSNLFHILNGGNKDDDGGSGNSKQSPLKKKKNYSPLEDEPWKNDDSYWDMLQKASKDPATFEKFIEESVAKKKKLGPTTSVGTSSLASSASSTALEAGESKKKKGTYQRIEEWDAQRQNGNGNMSEEERLQWECQKMGNQFRQNEILKHHLNSF